MVEEPASNAEVEGLQPSPDEERARRRRRRRALLLLLLCLLLVGLGSTSVYYYRFRRLPGPARQLPAITEVLGFVTPHFLMSIDGLNQPAYVAVSRDTDRIFVTESGGERLVRIFDYAGNPQGAFVVPGTTPATRSPGALAVSNDGNVWVIDRIRQQITIHDQEGYLLDTFVPDGNPAFEWAPVALTFDSEGKLYVVEQTYPRHQVLVFDANDKLALKFGYYGKGAGMFDHPSDIAVDDRGWIYVADGNNSRVEIFNPSGELLRVIEGSFSLPRSVALDRAGHLHVLDTLGHSVQAFSTDDPPAKAYTYGELGLGRGQFYFPTDLALDRAGRIYITDFYGNRIQVWSF